MTIAIRGKQHKTATDAVIELNFSGEYAISIGNTFLTVDASEYRRIQGMGMQPTTYRINDATGLLLSVPGSV